MIIRANLSRIVYNADSKNNSTLLINENSNTTNCKASIYEAFEPYTPPIYFRENRFISTCPVHNDIFKPSLKTISGHKLLALPISYKNRIPYNTSSNDRNMINHLSLISSINRSYGPNSNIDNLPAPPINTPKGFIFSLTNYFNDVLSINQQLFNLFYNYISVYIIDGYIYVSINRIPAKINNSIKWIGGFFKSKNKISSNTKFIDTTVTYSPYQMIVNQSNSYHSFRIDFVYRDSNKNPIAQKSLTIYAKDTSTTFDFTTMQWGSISGMWINSTSFYNSGNISNNPYTIYYTNDNNGNLEKVEQALINDTPFFDISETNHGLLNINDSHFSNTNLLFINNYYTSDDKTLVAEYLSQDEYDTLENNFSILGDFDKLDFYKTYYMFLDSNDPSETNESNILYRYISDLSLNYLMEIEEKFNYEKSLLDPISISIPQEFPSLDILNPISIDVKEDLEQDLLNPITLDAAKDIDPIDIPISIDVAKDINPVDIPTTIDVGQVMTEDLIPISIDAAKDISPIDILTTIDIKEDIVKDLLNPIEVTIGKDIAPVDPFEITVEATNPFKPIEEIEEYINKTYLGTQQAAEDFQLLYKVTEYSYWPVDFSIDNNYHIHIKKSEVYLGATLYACTNKQFLYGKYVI